MTNRFISYFVLVAFSLLAAPAGASVYEYCYSGHDLVTTDDYSATIYPEVLPGYSGCMGIDEALLPGGTLANASVSFSVADGDPLPAGLEYFTIFPFPAIDGSVFRFTTDASKHITSWFGDFLDGPPDGQISNVSGDIYFIAGSPNLTYTAPPGSWTMVAPVPLPASIALYLSALGLAGAFAWRRAGIRGRGPEGGITGEN